VSGSTIGLALSTMLASAVEFVEALTIVLAMGLTRGWRSTLAGTISALVLLAGVAAVAGYALITWFPKSVLQIAIGSLLLVFGLQWLRKSILRSSGLKALHDEDETFREETEAGRQAARDVRAGLDWFGFVVSFKGVFLEGLEVIFIVITFGLAAHSMPTAIAGASFGGVIVLIAGMIFHKPLSRVPENTIKFAVGLLLSTFGTFWSVEGLGVFRAGRASLRWPGGDVALLAVLAAWCALSWFAVKLLSSYARGDLTIAPSPLPVSGEETA
jgi:Ca2+/H+ antiporter, TMEM165/GDT1 family